MTDTALISDPYDILGVTASASPSDIKLAFRKKASFFHPDRNPDPTAAARFREAQAAYELLMDDERRRAHDQKRQKHLLDNPVEVARSMFQSYLDDIE
jgi:DnaJ-class molecular chaperone